MRFQLVWIVPQPSKLSSSWGSACHGCYNDNLSFITCTRNIWPLWWHFLAFRSPHYLPRSTRECSQFFWECRLQMPGKERNCRLFIGGYFQKGPRAILIRKGQTISICQQCWVFLVMFKHTNLLGFFTFIGMCTLPWKVWNDFSIGDLLGLCHAFNLNFFAWMLKFTPNICKLL